jgi:hypothetical protein
MSVDDGAARHFIPDAYVHAKFIGHVQTATTPMASSGGHLLLHWLSRPSAARAHDRRRRVGHLGMTSTWASRCCTSSRTAELVRVPQATELGNLRQWLLSRSGSYVTHVSPVLSVSRRHNLIRFEPIVGRFAKSPLGRGGAIWSWLVVENHPTAKEGGASGQK